VQRVLAGLLDDGVPIRDLVRILEAVGDRARTLRTVEAMIEAARHELGPAITSSLATDGRLTAVTMSAASENRLLQGLRVADGVSQLELLPDETDAFIRQLSDLANVAGARGINPVLLCSAPLRPAVARLVRATVPAVAVVSYTEIGDHLQIDVIANVDLAPMTTTPFGTSPEDFDAYAVS
jgi:flagellar biosynthesis protein FlhA